LIKNPAANVPAVYVKRVTDTARNDYAMITFCTKSGIKDLKSMFNNMFFNAKRMVKINVRSK
jgi:hypothetical protein